MNIKNPEAHRLAKELAEIERTSLTDAVVVSLREAIERRRTPTDAAERARRIRESARELQDAYAQSEGPSLWEIMDDLYDENGLPK